MAGSYIPVLEIEKLKFRLDGRGIYANSDGDVLGTDTWTGTSGSASGCTATFLPAASATRWLKFTSVSGTDGTETVGYVPVFNAYW